MKLIDSPETLKDARKKLGLTQAEMAEALGGTPHRTYQRWEEKSWEKSRPPRCLPLAVAYLEWKAGV